MANDEEKLIEGDPGTRIQVRKKEEIRVFNRQPEYRLGQTRGEVKLKDAAERVAKSLRERVEEGISVSIGCTYSTGGQRIYLEGTPIPDSEGKIDEERLRRYMGFSQSLQRLYLRQITPEFFESIFEKMNDPYVRGKIGLWFDVMLTPLALRKVKGPYPVHISLNGKLKKRVFGPFTQEDYDRAMAGSEKTTIHAIVDFAKIPACRHWHDGGNVVPIGYGNSIVLPRTAIRFLKDNDPDVKELK